MKKNAFTLIELLAVIVILAIIALIATPIVLNIIKDSKNSATLRSANFYLDSVENAIASSTLNNKKISNGAYNILKDGNLCIKYQNGKCIDELKIEVKGELPKSGKIIISNGKIKELIFNYKNQAVAKINNELKYIYKERENMEVPDLYINTLTPVIYDGDNWRVADVTEKWYDYKNQEWANAVILDSSVKKEIGDIIPVDGENPEALAMFVWIPRYEYKIEGAYGKGGTSASSPGEIEINFISSNQSKASDNYRIHPAFNFGGVDVSGIWVGKFEISQIKGSLKILPNVQSLRGNNVSNFFYKIKAMNDSNNTYGIDSNISDIHMMKNSEWGAVAYLTQSKYGKYGNSDYLDADKEVYINNSSSYYTGRSGGSYGGNTPVNKIYTDQSDITNQYNSYGYYTYDGYLLEYNTNKKTDKRYMNKMASTTGNIYGIYDMSGGAWEYLMSALIDANGEKWVGIATSGNSGFKGKIDDNTYNDKGVEWPEEKYYDIYKMDNVASINQSTACNGGICYGYALDETYGWFSDTRQFILNAYPWLRRGGYYSNGYTAGIFYYTYNAGFTNGGISTRVILTSAT